jgi:hypothetical protein
MNIRSLSNDALKEVIHQLLESDEARVLINKHPLLAANVPMLERARDAFARLKAPTPSDAAASEATQRKIDAVDAQIEEADARFDDAARGAFSLLTSAAQLSDEATRARLTALRDKLFARGLTVINLSAAEESGTARTLSEALDGADEALLDAVSLTVDEVTTSARALIRAHVNAGRKLGKLAAQREALLAQKAESDAPTEASERSSLERYSAARNAIVAAVADFRNDVGRAPGLTAAERGTLVGTIEKLAARRRPASKPAADDGEKTDP